MNASFRFAIGALMPFSALLAGLLGERLGVRVTLFICRRGHADLGAADRLLGGAPSTDLR